MQNLKNKRIITEGLIYFMCLIFRISKYSEMLHQELCTFAQTPGVLNHQVQIYMIWRTPLKIHLSLLHVKLHYYNNQLKAAKAA